MTFLPIIKLSASHILVGMDDQRTWVYQAPDGQFRRLDRPPAPVFLVTLLEWGERLQPALVQGLQAQALDPALAATFPVSAGVQLGLTSHSAHWQALAVRWIEREGSASEFLPDLESLSLDGRTQQIRQIARRLAHQAARASLVPE